MFATSLRIALRITAATTINDAPAGRESHTTAWTGSEMIIWGAYAGIPIFFNMAGDTAQNSVQPQRLQRRRHSLQRLIAPSGLRQLLTDG